MTCRNCEELGRAISQNREQERNRIIEIGEIMGIPNLRRDFDPHRHFEDLKEKIRTR
jgi:hypothetical protein